jgi:hypothetical protein
MRDSIKNPISSIGLLNLALNPCGAGYNLRYRLNKKIRIRFSGYALNVISSIIMRSNLLLDKDRPTNFFVSSGMNEL